MMRTLFVCSLFFLCGGGISVYLGYWLSAPATEPAQADLIVALGGGGGEREKMAAILYKAGYAKKILLTGIDGGLAPHRYFLDRRTQLLLDQGIPVEALLFDDQSDSTFQEAINTVALLQAYHWQSALVISDPPHMRRIKYSWQQVFNKAGLKFRLVQADAPGWQANRWWKNKRWAQYCYNEVVKLFYYVLTRKG